MPNFLFREPQTRSEGSPGKSIDISFLLLRLARDLPAVEKICGRRDCSVARSIALGKDYQRKIARSLRKIEHWFQDSLKGIVGLLICFRHLSCLLEHVKYER